MKMNRNEPAAVLFMMDSLLELAGSERNVFEIVTRLDPEKFRPSVVCMRGGNLVNMLRDRGVEVTELRLKRIYTFPAFVKALQVARLLREKDVKIVVTYHGKSDYFGGVVARLAGVPVVISSRRDMGYALRPRHILLYRLFNRFFDRIVTVSEAVKNTVADREKVPWHKLVTIYNGVNLEAYDRKIPAGPVRKSLGLEKEAPVAGILAVIRPVKGHRYFLEAASLIAKKYPRARFLAVGWTPDYPYFDEIKAYARSLGLEKSILFTGGRADTPEMLAAMDVPVFASENEGFSNAVLESMAAGKAVVATNSGGTAEAVVDGVTGLLVPPRDPRALAGAVLRLLDGRKRAAEMGKKGKERACRMFGMEKMMDRVEALFDAVLAEKMPERERRPLGPMSFRKIAGRAARQFSGNLAYYSGFVRLGRKIFPGRGIKILAYHRVTNDPFILPGMGIKVSHF
ncbi:MAG: glycosyltransferase, partial [Endomicrobiales bacterium]